MATETGMVTLTIDGREVTVPRGTLIIEAARRIGIDIPFFCYHPKMKTAAACRMCLVQIEKIPKLQPSCQVAVADGMVVHTNTPQIQDVRRGVLELTLINHPLDCPICDKGGECQLQDMTFGYGPRATRFGEEKTHALKAYPLGPLVMLDQERCIVCSRCVRFCEEVAGDPVLTFQERGGRTVVQTFEGRTFDSRFSGNTIEMCPVGALTSRPYRFDARPWDVAEKPSVCPHCPVGCNVTFTVRDNRVLRVLSRTNDAVDDGWLCDRGIFGYGYLEQDRLLYPAVRGEGGQLRECSWDEALEAVRRAFVGKGERAAVLGGGRLTVEGAYLVQRWAREQVGTPHLDHRVGGQRVVVPPGPPTRIQDVDDAHLILLVGTDPMEDAPVLGLRIRKAALRRGARVVAVCAAPLEEAPYPGLQVVHGRPEEAAGILHRLAEAVRAESPPAAGPDLEPVADLLVRDTKVVVVWDGRERSAGVALSRLLEARGERFTGVLVPGEEANSRGAAEAGLEPDRLPGGGRPDRVGLDARGILEACAAGAIDSLLVLDTDLLQLFPDPRLVREALARVPFLAVAAVQRVTGVERADAILPLAGYAETWGATVNMEGRAQELAPAVDGPGLTRPDWEVFRDLAGFSFPSHRAVRKELAAKLPGLDQPLGEPGRVREEALRPMFYADRHRPVGLEGRIIARAEPLLGDGEEAAPQAEGRALRAVRPLLLMTRSYQAEPHLEAVVPSPFVGLSPQDAASLGVADGDEVEVSGEAGAGTARVRILPRLSPGTVLCPRGFRPPLEVGEGYVQVRALAAERGNRS